MTIEEIKNQVAQEYEYESYDKLICAYDMGIIETYILDEFIHKCMHRIAEIVAIKQREIDAESADLIWKKGIGYVVDETTILSAPLASDKYKP